MGVVVHVLVTVVVRVGVMDVVGVLMWHVLKLPSTNESTALLMVSSVPAQSLVTVRNPNEPHFTDPFFF